MQYGFVKVAAITPDIRVADCEYNAHQIIAHFPKISENGVSLAVFPELCITGYSCGDLFFSEALINGALSALEKIRKESSSLPETVLIVGLPLALENKLYNCAVVILNGKILGVVPKSHLPEYREFQEKRYFSVPSGSNCEINICGKNIPFGTKLVFSCSVLPEFCFGVEICEDLWVACPPSAYHASAGATIIANLSASNETIGKAEYRRILVSSHSARLLCGYVYASAGEGESTTDLVFSGHNIIAENGTVIAETPLFKGGMAISEIDVKSLASHRQIMSRLNCTVDNYLKIRFELPLRQTNLTRKINSLPFVPNESDKHKICNEIIQMQALALKKRLRHTGLNHAVIGISGGLDSTLALIACVHCFNLLNFPTQNIIAVTMPCFGTISRTKSNAEKLSELLGVTLKSIDIKQSVMLHFSDIGHDESVHNAVYENSQARERTQVLMDIANGCEGLVIGTGDLSECALGWETFGGDHISMYALNASIPKTLIRTVVENYAEKCSNSELATVLRDILQTPISPELLPSDNANISQKTEDIIGSYELHDFFIYCMCYHNFGPKKIFHLAKYAFQDKYSPDEILARLKLFCKRFFSQQFKRSCMPDGPKITDVSLSPRGDFRMPSDACVSLWLSELFDLI